MGISLIIAACIVSLPLFRICRIVENLMAGINELNASIDQLDASVAALAAAVGSVQTPPDLQPSIDRINADRTAIDGLTSALGGVPPGP